MSSKVVVNSLKQYILAYTSELQQQELYIARSEAIVVSMRASMMTKLQTVALENSYSYPEKFPSHVERAKSDPNSSYCLEDLSI
jgi:hypothetical protein